MKGKVDWYMIMYGGEYIHTMAVVDNNTVIIQPVTEFSLNPFVSELRAKQYFKLLDKTLGYTIFKFASHDVDWSKGESL